MRKNGEKKVYPGGYTPITDRQIENWLDMRSEFTCNEIAKLTGFSRSTIEKFTRLARKKATRSMTFPEVQHG